MIIVTGTVRLKDGARAQAVEAARTMCRATLEEPGCQAYRFAFDLDDDHVVHIHEEWDDEDALAAHFAAPHFAEFGAKLGNLLAGAGEFHKFVGAERTSLF